ncbi:MAG TPA: hydroxyphenylacetyl-CoA thioesterase PaaI [Terriglobales bacterium]|nr:hydroxyphenylacetyl-CoA thioesterase PaaI [Terriglobales bacterium]
MVENPAVAMFERDQASQRLGMTLAEATPGYALVRMVVRDDMIQGHGTCHGGFVFALADSALAFACNGYGYTAVAANCSIDFLAPVRLGDMLTATAREQVRAGRTGIYDVAVTNQQGTVVALFRGRSRQVGDAK